MPTAFLRRVVAWSPATRHGQVRELRRLIGMLSESRAAVSSGGPDAAAHAHAPSLRDAMVADMEKRGYNPRYLSEIRGADIQKLQMR